MSIHWCVGWRKTECFDWSCALAIGRPRTVELALHYGFFVWQVAEFRLELRRHGQARPDDECSLICAILRSARQTVHGAVRRDWDGAGSAIRAEGG